MKSIDINDYRYFVAVTDSKQDNAIVHMVFYEEDPSKDNFQSLKEELATDEDLGLTEIAYRLNYTILPEEMRDEVIKANPDFFNSFHFEDEE